MRHLQRTEKSPPLGIHERSASIGRLLVANADSVQIAAEWWKQPCVTLKSGFDSSRFPTIHQCIDYSVLFKTFWRPVGALDIQ